MKNLLLIALQGTQVFFRNFIQLPYYVYSIYAKSLPNNITILLLKLCEFTIYMQILVVVFNVEPH